MIFPTMSRKQIPPADPNHLTDKEKNRIAVRKYQQANREKKKRDCKKFRKDNPEYFRKKKKEEQELVKTDPEYRENALSVRRKHYNKNRLKFIARQKAYADSHVEELKAYRKENSEKRSAASMAWRKKI